MVNSNQQKNVIEVSVGYDFFAYNQSILDVRVKNKNIKKIKQIINNIIVKLDSTEVF